uniref:WGS project CBMG000000000 data, contig CS5907-c001314 n=1 Tax=Fusarium acuminatum CS5907 TaxID=1318461 RepID=A0A096PFB9_9HYPO|nr:unnamed protein product [Fusarium acuminatum CS5907]
MLLTPFLNQAPDKVARRFFQQDADKSRSKIKELQQSVERSTFVLVLIDADADPYIFKDEYYAAGDGGRKASLALRDGAYANELGLSQFLVACGVIKAPRDLVEFAKDFTQALENTDFVLIGSGKDRADKKIQEAGTFKQFVSNPTCRHIIFGACHDNSYV